MNRTISTIISALSVVLFVACEKAEVTAPVKPDAEIFSVPKLITAPKEGKSQTIHIFTNTPYTYQCADTFVRLTYVKDSTHFSYDSKVYRVDIDTNHADSRTSKITFTFTSGTVTELNIQQSGRPLERIKDSLALVEFYHATGGENWTDNENWLSQKRLEQWKGIVMKNNRISMLVLDNNNLTGQLPKCIGQLDSLVWFEVDRNKLSGDIPEEIMKHKYYSRWRASRYIAWQQEGYRFTRIAPEEPYDLTNHGKVVQLVRATRGKGVDIVIVGDGFAPSTLVDGGVYETIMKGISANIFNFEPFKTYKEYFNVYYIKVASKDMYLADLHYPERETFFKSKIIGYNNRVIEGYSIDSQLKSLLNGTNIDFNNCTFMCVMNHDEGVGIASGNEAWFTTSITSVYNQIFIENRSETVIHELGHAFAGLHDEYLYKNHEMSPEALAYWRENYIEIERNTNISIHSDPTKVPWKHFIGRKGYEKVGVFAGAFTSQFYRSEEKSIMACNAPHFNTISRELIVKKIKERAGEPYDFNEFLSKDVIPQ